MTAVITGNIAITGFHLTLVAFLGSLNMPDKKCCVDGCDLSTPGNWTKKAILLFLELWGERYGLLNGDTDLDGKHIHEIFVDMGKQLSMRQIKHGTILKKTLLTLTSSSFSSLEHK